MVRSYVSEKFLNAGICVHIVVNVPPEPFAGIDSRIKIVEEGQTVKVLCICIGQAKWTFNDSILPYNVKNSTFNSIMLNDVTKHNEGTYECECLGKRNHHTRSFGPTDNFLSKMSLIIRGQSTFLTNYVLFERNLIVDAM